MKRVTLFLAACLLMLSTTLSASAETTRQNIEVTAKRTSATETPATFSVDISWTDMTFTYTQKETNTWNPATHSYKTKTKGAWDKKTAQITVTNHSNVDVQVRIVFSSIDGTGVSGSVSNGTKTLAAGTPGDYEGADTMTATLTIRGTPNETVTEEGTVIGTVKITLK